MVRPDFLCFFSCGLTFRLLRVIRIEKASGFRVLKSAALRGEIFVTVRLGIAKTYASWRVAFRGFQGAYEADFGGEVVHFEVH